MPYGSICCTYHQLKYSSLNRSKNPKQEPHKRAYTFWKTGFKEKRSQENVPKEEKDKIEEKKNGDIDKLTALRFQTEGRQQKYLAFRVFST